MIIFEERLAEIVALIPDFEINGNSFKINYSWGTIDELNQFLTTADAQQKYPLIWLTIDPNRIDLRENTATRNATILIAIRSEITELNPVIFNTEFKEVLNPITRNFIKAVTQSNISKFTNDRDIQMESLPKFSVNSNEKQVIDIWNVNKLVAGIEINSNKCLKKTINF